MKKLSKKVVALVAACVMVVSTAISVSAAHAVGCGATGTTSVCGTNLGTTGSAHTLYKAENGQVVTCFTLAQARMHSIYCIGCGNFCPAMWEGYAILPINTVLTKSICANSMFRF
ncbi:MAG: hypothetical protein LBI36_03395 [Oscillospiraceae bacterium]|jgi:hypothetical protein|nr:hypothetical protein [Oscillospiraceae bacterium]